MQKHCGTHAQTPCVSGQVCSCSVGVEVKKSCGFRQDGAARPKALAPSVLSPLIADMHHHAPGHLQNRLHWTKMQSCPPSPHTHTHTAGRKKDGGKTPAWCDSDKKDRGKKPCLKIKDMGEIYIRKKLYANLIECELNKWAYYSYT